MAEEPGEIDRIAIGERPEGGFMIYIIVYVLAFLIFLSAPLPLQIVFIVFNFFVPDPIPILDEAFMMASIFKKIGTASRIMDFAEEHPDLVKVIILSTLIIAGILLKIFII